MLQSNFDVPSLSIEKDLLLGHRLQKDESYKKEPEIVQGKFTCSQDTEEIF